MSSEHCPSSPQQKERVKPALDKREQGEITSKTNKDQGGMVSLGPVLNWHSLPLESPKGRPP